MQLPGRSRFLALAAIAGALAIVLAAGTPWEERSNQISPSGVARMPGTSITPENSHNSTVTPTEPAESSSTTAPVTSTIEVSYAPATAFIDSTPVTYKIAQSTETVNNPSNHIARIRLEQAPGEFTAPEIIVDLRSLTIDGRKLRVLDELGNEILPIFYIQPRIWQEGDDVSPTLESHSREESRKHSDTAEFSSTDGTGHDSIVQRGADSIVELHSWKSRSSNGRIILQPGELFKLILDGPDLVINQGGQQYAVARHTPEEIQHIIHQLTGQTFYLYQTDGRDELVKQKVQIKWIYKSTPSAATAYYRSGAVTVRQMLERDHGIIPKQQPGEAWLQFCTMRTVDQARETYGRGGAARSPRLIDHEQTLTNISIIPVIEQ